jgi:hypothetical protein
MYKYFILTVRLYNLFHMYMYIEYITFIKNYELKKYSWMELDVKFLLLEIQ